MYSNLNRDIYITGIVVTCTGNDKVFTHREQVEWVHASGRTNKNHDIFFHGVNFSNSSIIYSLRVFFPVMEGSDDGELLYPRNSFRALSQILRL